MPQRTGVAHLYAVSIESQEAADDIAGLAVLYGQRLQALAYFMSGDLDVAQDAVQTVLLRITRQPTSANYHYGYARRAVINEVAGHHRQLSTLRRYLPRLVGRQEQDSHEQQVVDRHELVQALRELPPKQRAATVLRYFEDATFEEIADVLECETATARSLVSRGLKALRKTLEGQPDGPL